MVARESTRQKYHERLIAKKVSLFRSAYDEAVQREKANACKIVSFSVTFHTHFGQNLYVVGSASQLGAWNPTDALPMVWTDGDVWRASVKLPQMQSLDYKFVVVNENEVIWEPGKNHFVNLRDTKGNSLTMKVQWGGG